MYTCPPYLSLPLLLCPPVLYIPSSTSLIALQKKKKVLLKMSFCLALSNIAVLPYLTTYTQHSYLVSAFIFIVMYPSSGAVVYKQQSRCQWNHYSSVWSGDAKHLSWWVTLLQPNRTSLGHHDKWILFLSDRRHKGSWELDFTPNFEQLITFPCLYDLNRVLLCILFYIFCR